MIIAIGSVGPWVDLGTKSLNGVDKDGTITLALALVAAGYVVFMPRPHWAPMAALGVLATGVAIWEITDIPALATPGFGLYLTAIGGVALVLAAVTAIRTASDTSASLGFIDVLIIGVAATLLAVVTVVTLTTEDTNRPAKQPGVFSR